MRRHDLVKVVLTQIGRLGSIVHDYRNFRVIKRLSHLNATKYQGASMYLHGTIKLLSTQMCKLSCARPYSFNFEIIMKHSKYKNSAIYVDGSCPSSHRFSYKTAVGVNCLSRTISTIGSSAA